MSAERERLNEVPKGRAPWRRWGPYLAERAWGTVREDYSATGEAWDSFPHDQARSRAYRWNEDGLAGVCDRLRQAQVKWGSAPLDYRIEVLTRWADELGKAYGPLAAADSADTGGCLISPIAPGIAIGSVRAWAADA